MSQEPSQTFKFELPFDSNGTVFWQFRSKNGRQRLKILKTKIIHPDDSGVEIVDTKTKGFTNESSGHFSAEDTLSFRYQIELSSSGGVLQNDCELTLSETYDVMATNHLFGVVEVVGSGGGSGIPHFISEEMTAIVNITWVSNSSVNVPA